MKYECNRKTDCKFKMWDGMCCFSKSCAYKQPQNKALKSPVFKKRVESK